MKNKSVTYLLGAVVFLIWGLVFYRLFNADGDENIVSPNYSSNLKPTDYKILSDTFELIADYRDPFLGHLTMSNIGDDDIVRSKIKRKAVAPKVELPPPPLIDWSFVTYLGTIHGKKNKKKLAILKVNDRELMVGNNEKIGDLSILKIGKDSVLVSFQGVQKVLR